MQLIQQSAQGGLLRPLRKLGLAIASRWPRPVSVKLASGRRMFVDLRSSIGRALFMKGEFDPMVFPPLRAALKPGGTFLDVGANVGYYSLLGLDCVGGAGQVHAFEIDPRPLACLRKTVPSECLRNLAVHEVAAGNRDGTATLVACAESGHSRVAQTLRS